MTNKQLRQLVTLHCKGLTRSGFGPGDQIAQKKLEVALVWIKKNMKPSKKAISSYSLKSRIEIDTGHYMSNGEAIAASLMLGYRFKRDGLNAKIYATTKKIIYGKTEAKSDGDQDPKKLSGAFCSILKTEFPSEGKITSKGAFIETKKH